MTDLTTIEALTKDYATARDLLAERLQSLNDEVEALKRRRMTGLKSAVRSMATAQDKLYSSIKGNPELFMKPRTLVIQGIKVGMAKGKGKICIDDPAMAIKLIRKHFPEQADVLIKTEEKPVAKAIGQLTVPELKRIGVTVEEAGDQVVIKPTDSEVDKLISALIADATEEPMDGAA